MSRRRRWLIFEFATAVALVSAWPVLGGAGPAPAGAAGDPAPATRPAGSKLFRLPARRTSTGPAAPATAPAPASAESRQAESAVADAEVHVSTHGTIELHVADTDLSSVLKLLSRQSHRNIVASKNVSGKVTADLYDLTLEQTLDAILGANNCTWQARDHLIYVSTNDELAKIETARNEAARIEADHQPPACRVFHLKHISAEEAGKLIQPLLSKDGKVTSTTKSLAGVAEGGKEAAGNASAGDEIIMVVDAPEQIEVIAEVIEQIDERPKQVLIEATILRAQLNEDNALGIDFNIVGGVDFKMLGAASTGGTDLTVGDLPKNRLDNTNTAFRQDLTAGVPQGGFTFGIIKNDVGVFLRALEQITDTSVIANPKVLALNKQRGEVIVGRRDGYLTTTVTQTASIQNVEFLETGTQLIFRPYVEDNGYVRMEIHPKDSTGGLTAANLPFEQTTEVTTNITVRDGYTILIGGLFREVSTASHSQTPIVGNIPVLGWLFRGTHDSTQREEVIILLTVHVVKDEQQLAADSHKLADDMERYRVSLRDSFLPYGRERLAQAHYHWAMEHLSKGHTNRAMWDATIAAHLNPTFLDAIELSEKISNRRAFDREGSSVRDFVLKEALREKGITGPLYGRPQTEIPDQDAGKDRDAGDRGTDKRSDRSGGTAKKDAPSS